MRDFEKARSFASGHGLLSAQQSNEIEAALGREIEPIVGPAIAPDVVKKTVAILHKTEVFSGPLPPPSQLEAYENIFPGFAGRIMAMAEKEQNNRHAMHALQVEHHVQSEKFSLRIALIFGIALILGACVCAYFRQVEIGCALVGVFGLSGIGFFVKGRPVSHADDKGDDTGPTPDKTKSNSSSAQKRPRKRH